MEYSVLTNTFTQKGVDYYSLRGLVEDKLMNDIIIRCDNTIIITNDAGVRFEDT